jgi:hypothetical protein
MCIHLLGYPLFMAMYSFVPPFRKATFCGVPLCVIDKLGCAASEKRLRNTALEAKMVTYFHDKNMAR